MRVLDALGDELVRAARAEEAAALARRRRRVGPFPRAVAIGLAMALLLAAVAVAASLVIGRGDPIPAAPRGAVPRELQPVPGTARLNGLDVADPDGGPAWDVRTSRSRTGAVCAAVGQVLDGELGIVGLDRRFHALPAGAADTCSTPQRTGATLAGARAFRGGGAGGLQPITVVSGVAGADVARAVAAASGADDVELKLGPGRAFLAIFPGTPEQRRPVVRLFDANGVRRTLHFADTGEYLTPDSGGGTPWTVQQVTHRVDGGLRCIAAQRERGPDSPAPGSMGVMTASTPPRCAAPGVAFAAVRRFSPVRRSSWGDYYWDVNPARTMVWGAVARPGTAVRVRAAGVAERDVAVDPRTLGFAAALDGKVDPATVEVTVDGRVVKANAGVRNRRGRLLPPPADPGWRSVASAGPLFRAQAWRPRRASIRVAHRVADPVGGPRWLQRVWTADVPRAQRVSPGMSRTLTCFAVGVAGRGGSLVLPLGEGRTRRVGFTEGDGFCNDVRYLAHKPAGIMVRVPLDDATAPDPRPVRVVAAGLVGRGVASAQLLGLASGPRSLKLDADGAWLEVLPGSEAGRPLRVRIVRDDGRVQTSTAEGGGPPPCGVTPAAAVRVADPDGAAPWAAGSRRTGASCSFITQVVDDRFGTVDEDEGTVRFGPGWWSGGRSQLGGGAPVTVQVQGPGQGPQDATHRAPSAAQVVRRTLPGRTFVYGLVRPDVLSITLRTPRDIRTLTPSAGTFLAVYDGAFYGGEVSATAKLRDGSSTTVTQPAALLLPAG